MAETGKLYITISDQRSGGGDGTPTPATTPKEKKDESNTLGRYIEHQAFHIVKQQAVQAANFVLGNIGNFTGDYATQTRINEMRKTVSGFMQIGVMTLAGAKYGPVGVAVGFIVGTISAVSSGVYDTIQKSVENSKINYEISQLRERAGLNSSLDGSRGTEN